MNASSSSVNLPLAKNKWYIKLGVSTLVQRILSFEYFESPSSFHASCCLASLHYICTYSTCTCRLTLVKSNPVFIFFFIAGIDMTARSGLSVVQLNQVQRTWNFFLDKCTRTWTVQAWWHSCLIVTWGLSEWSLHVAVTLNCVHMSPNGVSSTAPLGAG